MRLYHIPFSPNIYKNAAAANANESIFVYMNTADNPLEITLTLTCFTNHMNIDTVNVTRSGALYTSADFAAVTPLAIFGL